MELTHWSLSVRNRGAQTILEYSSQFNQRLIFINIIVEIWFRCLNTCKLSIQMKSPRKNILQVVLHRIKSRYEIESEMRTSSTESTHFFISMARTSQQNTARKYVITRVGFVSKILFILSIPRWPWLHSFSWAASMNFINVCSAFTGFSATKYTRRIWH